MSTYAPPPPPVQNQPEEERRACPVCQGAGEIPASMSKDEMLQAMDQNMPSPEAPEAGELHEPTQSFSKPELSTNQLAEVDRLGERARERMKGPRSFGS